MHAMGACVGMRVWDWMVMNHHTPIPPMQDGAAWQPPAAGVWGLLLLLRGHGVGAALAATAAAAGGAAASVAAGGAAASVAAAVPAVAVPAK